MITEQYGVWHLRSADLFHGGRIQHQQEWVLPDLIQNNTSFFENNVIIEMRKDEAWTFYWEFYTRKFRNQT